MTLSSRTRESIKTALAMTIAYGIALSMDWDKPYWAGFAVAFISLATIGQSLNKATLRIFGTLMGMAVALTLIALFAQDRWLFIIFLSIWIGVCTYMMGGAKNQYFWNVGGFVCAVICIDAGPDSANAFQIAALRAQETGLGILVYSLVSVFLWPSNSSASFESAVGKLASTQHQLYQAYFALMKGKGDIDETQSLKTQAIQQQLQFNQLLDAAEGDSYEVRELRHAWHRYQGQVTKLGETLERWHDSLAGQLDLEVQRLLPNLDAFGDELDRRFAQIESMFANQAPAQQPARIELALDKDAVKTLPYFQQAALAVSRKRLQHIETLSLALFNTVSDIKGFGPPETMPAPAAKPPVPFIPDPDRVFAAARIMLILWLAWLTAIYVNGIPGGTGLLSMAAPFGMALASMPQLPISKLFIPAFSSVLFTSCLYIFVMPRLSSFTGLGLMIFTVTFAICYLFSEPRQILDRVFGLAMFVVVTSISNQQTYSFLGVANTAMMFPIIFVFLIISAYIPFSPRPERTILRLLGRFFRSSEYLMSTLRRDPGYAPTKTDQWKKAFHGKELAALPQKLGAWAGHINTKVLPGTSPEQVQLLVTNLQVLTYRMQELIEAGANPQSEQLAQELLTDFRGWRLKVQDAFMLLAKDPTAAEQETFRSKLDEFTAQLETRIQETMDQIPEGRLDTGDAENFYHLLGAYRGVSEALVDYAGNSHHIDWTYWRDERFA